MKPIYAIAAFLTLLMAACSADPSYFSEFRPVNPSQGWRYGDTVTFAPQRHDTATPVNLSLIVRHANDYAYSNLWLEVTYLQHGMRKCDTLNVELADPYGRWRGKGFGAAYQTEVYVDTAVTVDSASHIAVRHIMRVDTLKGIEQLGVALRKH